MAQIIAYAIFAGFGLVMLYVGLTEFTLQRQALAAAVPVEAVITRSEVRESVSSDTDHRPLRDNSTRSYSPEIRFQFPLGSVLHDSELLRPTIIHQGHASRESAQAELDSFPVGARVTAWVDPEHPDRAFLLREASIGPVVFIIIGVVLPPLAWLGSRFC